MGGRGGVSGRGPSLPVRPGGGASLGPIDWPSCWPSVIAERAVCLSVSYDLTHQQLTIKYRLYNEGEV